MNKKESLQYFITDFVIEVGIKADKERYNKAWTKLWKRIHRIKLFEEKK